MQVVLDESAELIRAVGGTLICVTHHGFVCANAGVDASNAGADGTVILLPEDPDASARRLRHELGCAVGSRTGSALDIPAQILQAVRVDRGALGTGGHHDEVAIPGRQPVERGQKLLALRAALRTPDARAFARIGAEVGMDVVGPPLAQG